MQTISVEPPFQATNTETSESVTDRKYINAWWQEWNLILIPVSTYLLVTVTVLVKTFFRQITESVNANNWSAKTHTHTQNTQEKWPLFLNTDTEVESKVNHNYFFSPSNSCLFSTTDQILHGAPLPPVTILM